MWKWAESDVSLVLSVRVLSLVLWSPRPRGFRDALAPPLVQKIDNDVVLLDAEAVEVLADHVGQLVFPLAPQVSLSCHRRGL